MMRSERSWASEGICCFGAFGRGMRALRDNMVDEINMTEPLDVRIGRNRNLTESVTIFDKLDSMMVC